MRKRFVISDEKGLTLMEIMVTMGLFAMVTLFISSWIARPTTILNKMLMTNMENAANNAANIFATDLQTADPNSIPWTSLSPSSISFTRPNFDFAHPTTVVPPVSVSYTFSPKTNGVGTLLRHVGNVQTVLLDNVVTPTTSAPLLQVDSTTISGVPLYNMLVLSFSYKPPTATAPIPVVRHVAVTG